MPAMLGAPTISSCFNEAGGFLPRKLERSAKEYETTLGGASMRPGDFSPGNGRIDTGRLLSLRQLLQ